MMELTAVVTKANPGSKFDVEVIDNGAIVHCTISGKIRTNYIRIVAGDYVLVEVSPYDLSKGRITFRFKDKTDMEKYINQ